MALRQVGLQNQFEVSPDFLTFSVCNLAQSFYLADTMSQLDLPARMLIDLNVVPLWKLCNLDDRCDFSLLMDLCKLPLHLFIAQERIIVTAKTAIAPRSTPAWCFSVEGGDGDRSPVI